MIKNFFETFYQNFTGFGVSMSEFIMENAEAVMGFLLFAFFGTIFGYFAYILLGLIYHGIKDYFEYRKAVKNINIVEVDKIDF